MVMKGELVRILERLRITTVIVVHVKKLCIYK
jgi:hypothetical protein